MMLLFCKSVTNETPELVKEGVRVRFIGRRDRFSEEVRERLMHIEDSTIAGQELTLVLAFDYSSREELTRAVREIAKRIESGSLRSEDVSEQSIIENLYTADIPDPDFIIRTSGECRLSNFLLWQASYAEMYFPETLWPDFREEAFDKAMVEYAQRNRRYGVL